MAGGWSVVLVLGVTVVPYGYLNLRAPRPGWRYFGSAAVLVAAIVGTFAAQGVVLTTSGQEVTAVVVSIGGYDGKTGHHTTYSLDTLNGTPVGSQFEPDDGSSYSVGDHLTVFADPTGRVDPEPPDDMNTPAAIFVAVLALALAAISQILMWRPRRQDQGLPRS